MTEPWTKQDREQMIDLLTTMTEPGFEVATWPKLESRVVDGKVFHQMPYPEYHPLVDEFRRLAFATSCVIDPSAALPEDPPGVDVPRVLMNPDEMKSASVDQIRRYFCLCIRGERFSEGKIEGTFKSGMMTAALERLLELESAED